MIQKLIDANEFRREMFRKCIETDEEVEKGRAKWESGLWIRYKVFEDTIKQMPSVQPEQKHGKWLNAEHAPNYLCYCTCSVCGKRQTIEIANYCPNCGVKMDMERE